MTVEELKTLGMKQALEAKAAREGRTMVTVVAATASLTVPRDRWPLYARAVAAVAAVSDAGVGDTIARNAARLGANAMARAFKRLTGRDCGCGDRQAALNRLYPYER